MKQMKKETIKKNRCSNCANWKNQQSELEYSKFVGICTAPQLKFGTANYLRPTVLDRRNLSEKHTGVNEFENVSSVVPVGNVNKSRYCLITCDEFSCINHVEKESKQS